MKLIIASKLFFMCSTDKKESRNPNGDRFIRFIITIDESSSQNRTH